MTKDLETSIDKIWDKLDEIEQNEQELDKRLTVNEEMQKLIKHDVNKVESKIDGLTESFTKLEIKIAYAAGGFAVAVIIAQSITQALFR